VQYSEWDNSNLYSGLDFRLILEGCPGRSLPTKNVPLSDQLGGTRSATRLGELRILARNAVPGIPHLNLGRASRLRTPRLEHIIPLNRPSSSPQPQPTHWAAADSYLELATSINLAWSKLDKYYIKLDDSPTYYVALMLYPHYRLRYFDEFWKGSLVRYLAPMKKTL
jgi:hypothetical protein